MEQSIEIWCPNGKMVQIPNPGYYKLDFNPLSLLFALVKLCEDFKKYIIGLYMVM